MIRTIEIIRNNGLIQKTNLILIYELNVCYLDNKKYQVSDEFKKDLVRTIRTWKTEYGQAKGIDAEEFKITVTTDKGKDVMHGKGIYPDNYEHLIKLIGDIDGRYREI